MSEKKVNTIQRIGNSAPKHQDQTLSGFSGLDRAYGKISAQKPQTNPNTVPQNKPVQKPVTNPKIVPQNKPVQKPKMDIGKIQAPVKENNVNTNISTNISTNVSTNQDTQKNVATNKTNNKPRYYNKYNKNKKPKAPKVAPSLKVYFLGGLNEIGKNFTLFECQDEMIIVDCGLAFPADHMLGIDIVIPDFTFIEKNIDKIKGVVITHGHEDHIGAIPYLLKKIDVPVYGTPLTMGLIKVKLKEHNLHNSARLNPLPAGSHIKLGCFDVELIHVNHSISDAVGLAIHTPAGTLVHTGDFKIDFTPTEGGMIDLARFAELGKQGVLALMADSTNVERAGYTMTEQKVSQTLDMLFARAQEKRIVVATFASNISRVQQIINCAIKYKRKVALSGRSMLNVVAVATELGYLKVPEGLIIDLSIINRYERNQIVLITTGSQGEPMAALSRMAAAEHRQVSVGENDFIIISARPIPGNEKTVGGVVDDLLKRGCEVVYESMYEVHVSGHACQEELKLIHSLVKPKYFIPVHGEQKHLMKHAALAMSLGMPKENIFIGDVGKGIELNKEFIKQTPDVPAGEVMVDGIGVGDVGSIVLRDRKLLGEDGLIIAVCTIDSSSGQLVSGPDVVSRGFVYVRESEELMETAKKIVFDAVQACCDENVYEWNAIKLRIRDGLGKFLYEKTRRKPMILPIIMEI
ncbi:MAG: ribonuclease J [Clostridia bacterium]